MKRSVLGIDVSKATLDVVLRRDGMAEQHAVFDNDLAGIKRLAKWLKKRQAGETHVCLEATGLYGDEVALSLHEAGHVVSVVNPAQIKAHGQSRLLRNKTDAIDAALIADFCLKEQPAAWTPPDPAWLDLRAMARQLDHLQTIRQQEHNRLQAGVTTPLVLEALRAHIAFLDQQITVLQQHIQDHIDQHPALRQQRDLLTSIPGIGPVSASQILAEIRDIRAFHSAAQLAAFAGLTPRHRQSGSSVRGYTPLSKIGSPALRKALFFPALSARRCNPLIRAFCDRLAARGKPPMLVIGAAMRKLLHLIFGVIKSGQPFDPAFQAAS
jgi:transposase